MAATSKSTRPLPCWFTNYMLVAVISASIWREGAGQAQHVNCTKITSCSCRLANGAVIDLTPLDKKTGVSASFSAKDLTGDTYQWNPCTDFTNSAAYACKDVASCQVRSTDSYTLGSQSSAQFTLDSQRGLELSYSATQDGALRTAYVALQCGTSAANTFTASGESGFGSAKYYMTLTSIHCCPVGGGGGISPGSVLVIIFFALLVVYLIAGALFMKFGRGATGTEIVPNKSFWTDLPSLIKDGVMFLVNGCKPGSGTSYETIK